MRRFAGFVLALALMLTFSFSVFSATVPSDDNSCDVQLVINKNDEKVYMVDIKWDNLLFQYKLGKWDTDQHLYSDGTLGWVKSGNQESIEGGLKSPITITNHSNADVYIGITKTDNANKPNTITVGLQDGEFALGPAVENGDATSNTDFVTVSGSPKNTFPTQVVSHITISISKTANWYTY